MHTENTKHKTLQCVFERAEGQGGLPAAWTQTGQGGITLLEGSQSQGTWLLGTWGTGGTGEWWDPVVLRVPPTPAVLGFPKKGQFVFFNLIFARVGIKCLRRNFLLGLRCLLILIFITIPQTVSSTALQN